MGIGNGIIGRLARRIVRGLVRFYYPNIEISGAERLPVNGPLLLAANHQNSLMDPVMVGIVARRPVRFLAKAPLFQIPVFGNILHALGMMPAYRRADDPTQTHRTLESLTLAAARLKDGEAVGIFPEGKSHDAPRIEPVKTGAARMAIQAVHEGAMGLKLVPVGLNYESKELFRSAVWVRVGEPIDMNAWIAQHDVEERQAVRELSAELDRRLKELVVHLDEPSWEPFLYELEVLLPPPRESRRNPFAWLRQRKRLADAMNHFMRADRARAEAVAEKLRQGRARLAAAGLTARSSVLRRRGWRLTWRLAYEAVLMDLGFVLVLIGTLFHLVPFVLTRFVARFVQAPGRSTIALARFGLGIPFYGAWYAFHAWWMSQYFLPWVAWAWLLPMPFAGLLALQYWRRVKRTSPAWWRSLAMACQPARLRELRAEHDRLRALLQEMAREFVKARPVEPLPLNTFSWRRFAWGTARWCAVGAAVFFAVAWLRTQLRDDDIGELDQPPPRLRQLSNEALATSLEADEQTLTSAMSSLEKLEASGPVAGGFSERAAEFLQPGRQRRHPPGDAELSRLPHDAARPRMEISTPHGGQR
jgi:1-acyl-sn-glycerol-3-phosphate acyltransferase